jgi:hypothetical protein
MNCEHLIRSHDVPSGRWLADERIRLFGKPLDRLGRGRRTSRLILRSALKTHSLRVEPTNGNPFMNLENLIR